jgi:isoleucyl-tRNA synthetase
VERRSALGAGAFVEEVSGMKFDKVSPQVDLPRLEEEILDLWKRTNAFERSVHGRPEDRPFVFYEGPPTANGRPGFHHALARAFKDLIPRYKTMQGYRVERKGGWDCHGLPVEIQVEKELGLDGKADIERYGVEVVERIPLSMPPNPSNVGYLRTKREKMGHLFPKPVALEVAGGGLGQRE